MPPTDEDLAFLDNASHVECFIEGDKVYITLPSQVWLNPDQADALADAIKALAFRLRAKKSGDSRFT